MKPLNYRIVNPLKVVCILFLTGLLTSQIVLASQDDSTQISGQEGVSVQMDVTVGFDGYYRTEIPTPLRVRIFNGGESFFNGKVVIKTKTWVPDAIYSHKVNIPPGETEILDMFIYEGKANETDVILLNTRNRIVQQRTVEIHKADIDRDALVLLMSDNPDDFKFLDSLSIQRLWKFKSAPLGFSTGTQFDLSSVNIVKEIPPFLYNRTTAWDQLSAVYCDLGKYINLDPDLKKNLQAWVNLGGELLLYPPAAKLDDSEIDAINSDSFLPFKVLGYSSSGAAIDDKYQLINTQNDGFVCDVEYSSTTLVYEFADESLPLIASMVSQSGGIVLFRFHPSAINTDKVLEWVEIFFQLGLLTPTSYKADLHRGFMRLVEFRRGRGSHVQTEEERISSGIHYLGEKYLLKLILPLTVIWLVGGFCLRRGRKMLFLYYILPVLILIVVFLPQALIRKSPMDVRQFEAYHFINLAGKGMPAVISSNYIIGKLFPQSGKLVISSPDGFSFYDEMVILPLGKHPVLEVDCTPPGSLSSNEITPENLRFMMGSSESSEIGSVDGAIKVSANGDVEFEITNNTGLKLVNCEIFPYKLHFGIQQLPRMISDMNPGQTVKGFITGKKDDGSIDNDDIRKFVAELDDGIFSFATREELFFRFETRAAGSAFKLNRPYYAYSDVAQFYASTLDFSKHLTLNGSPINGPEVTFVLGKLDIELPDEYQNVHTRDIFLLLPDAPNHFRSFKPGEMPEIPYSGAFYGLK